MSIALSTTKTATGLNGLPSLARWSILLSQAWFPEWIAALLRTSDVGREEGVREAYLDCQEMV